RLLERIEVHADKVERLDRVLVERREVVLAIAAREDAGMNGRVQRLDAAAEQLGNLGERLDGRHLEAELLEVGGRSTARDELAAEVGEPDGERVETALVPDGDQRAHSVRTTSGRIRCSTACTRRRRLSTVSSSSTGTSSLAITGPVSTPSST